MKSLVLHYKNKYPNGRVSFTDSSLDVYSESGEHVVAMRKNGAGQMICVSEEYGLRDRHDLAPIPKDSRVHKLVDGKIAHDEMAEERKKLRDQFICQKRGDVVLSCADLSKQGMSFDDKQKLSK